MHACPYTGRKRQAESFVGLDKGLYSMGLCSWENPGSPRNVIVRVNGSNILPFVHLAGADHVILMR